MNEAVPALTRLPLVSVLKELPPRHMLAWVSGHRLQWVIVAVLTKVLQSRVTTKLGKACSDKQRNISKTYPRRSL